MCLFSDNWRGEGCACSVIMEGRWMCLFSDNCRGDGCACSVITGGEMDVPVQ